jgi:hypothetical protein
MLEIILSQLYACEICLTQLTRWNYKQRVTHWESRFQAGLSSTCRHVGTLEAQFCRYYQNLHWMDTTQRKNILKYTYIQSKNWTVVHYIQSKNWTARFRRNGNRYLYLFSQRTELLGSNETESDTYIQAKNWEEVSYPLYGDKSVRHHCFSTQCYLTWVCNHIIVPTRKVPHKNKRTSCDR